MEMNRVVHCCAAVLLLAAGPLLAQSSVIYIERATGANQFALGFSPPIPRNSATPLDAFRTYQSLHARHQDLMLQHDFIRGEVVGQSREGAEIWAYVIGDPDPDTRHGGPESSLLINGGIHAREWGTPELTTALIEAAVDHAGDGWLWDYLVETVHFTVLPVNNVDGFRQTQRYPTLVLVGADPRWPQFWPRDGRMRRKNMRDADTALFSFGDHLNGVDLNRNFDPFWASSTGSSSNPAELVYHGPAAFSEPESHALLAAAELARPDRLRWYQDTHSFTQVILSKRTFNARRNALQSALARTFRDFHNALSLQRHGRERIYPESPDSAGAGIGVTAEYFGVVYEIPSWTLEIEPRQSAAEYGGFGTEHDGFILPDSEVRRLRDDMALTHAVLAYRQAGPPALLALEVLDEHGEAVIAARWHYLGEGLRERMVTQQQALLPERSYRLRLGFDKPMRWHGEAGAAAAPGHPQPLHPVVRLVDANGTPRFEFETTSGRWADGSATAPVDAWRYDHWQLDFSLSAAEAESLSGELLFEIETADFTGQALDADPTTAVDWSDGAWSGYEDDSGVAGDLGGPDHSHEVRIFGAAEARRWQLRNPPAPPGRGELLRGEVPGS
jgi:hypothetical protein